MVCIDVTKALKSHFDMYAPSFASALENVNFRRAFGARRASVRTYVIGNVWLQPIYELEQQVIKL